MPVFMFELDTSKLGSGASDAIKIFDTIGNSANKAKNETSGFSKASSTARQNITRLATSVAGLISVYKALEVASSFMREGFKFSAEMETARIGIASVISATTDLVDSQGNMLEGQKKYNSALNLSSGIMNNIRIMGLETTATTSDLVAGFQAMIAPATAVGMTMEQTQEFTLNMVKALGAMGIPLNQLSAEGRSLLDGTIIPTQDRLAMALGITGEMVKKWKEQGILVDELRKKLSPFASAGVDVAESWAGLSSNMKDAIGVLSGFTGQGFFTGVKEAYKDILTSIVDVKNAKPGKDIENIANKVKELEDFMGGFVQRAASDFIEWLSIMNRPENLEVLESRIKTVYNSLNDAGRVAASVGSGIGKIFGSALDGWNSMPEIIRDIGIVGGLFYGIQGVAITSAIGFAIDQIQKLKVGSEKYSGMKRDDVNSMLENMGLGSLPEPKAPSLARSRTLEPMATSHGTTKNGEQARNDMNALRDAEKNLASERISIQKISIGTMSDADNAFTKSAKENSDIRAKAVNNEYEKAIEAQKKALEASKKISQSKIQSANTDEERKIANDLLKSEQAKYTKNISILEEERRKKLKGIVNKGGSSSTTSDSARRALEGLNAEIAKLRGEGESFDFALSKKLMEIAKLGKDAGLSLGEITAKQREFADAATTKRAEDLGKAIADVDAKIAGMWGDQSQSRGIKLEQEIDGIRDKLKNLGAETPLIEEKLAKFREGASQQFIVEDAQLAASFMKELAQLSGEYGASQAAINEQLRIQADIYGSKLPESMRGYVDEWERLQKLQSARDPMSGLERGMRKYVSSATDYASQFEDAWTNTMTSFEDVWVRAMTTGKISFSDLANSLLKDMARIAAKQALGGIVSGLGSLIGGFFTGGGVGGDTGGSLTGIGSPGWVNPGFNAKGNVFSGGDISAWSGKIVNSPTFFSSNSVSAYALGGNVMGENGEEGIFPLKRNRSGKLGVEASFDYASLARASQPTVAYAKSPQITINPTVIDRTERGVSVEMKEQKDNNGNVRLEYVVGDLAAKQANTPGTNLNRSLTRNGMSSPAVRR